MKLKYCSICNIKTEFNIIVYEEGNSVENCGTCGHKEVIGTDKFKEKYKDIK